MTKDSQRAIIWEEEGGERGTNSCTRTIFDQNFAKIKTATKYIIVDICEMIINTNDLYIKNDIDQTHNRVNVGEERSKNDFGLSV